MNGKNLLEGRVGPQTQSLDAVKALLTYRRHPTEPMPQCVELDGGRLMLILNGKKDAYYVCTAKACSCPSASFRPGEACKHQRKYFHAKELEVANGLGEIRPDMRGFRPVSPLPGEVEEVA